MFGPEIAGKEIFPCPLLDECVPAPLFVKQLEQGHHFMYRPNDSFTGDVMNTIAFFEHRRGLVDDPTRIGLCDDVVECAPRIGRLHEIERPEHGGRTPVPGREAEVQVDGVPRQGGIKGLSDEAAAEDYCYFRFN